MKFWVCGGGVGGGIPSDYLVSTELQLWLFCCWGCGCCWAVTIPAANANAKFDDIVFKMILFITEKL